MAGFAKSELRLAQPSVWFDQLAALLARELAPNSRKLRSALRMTTIATIGAGLIASCHVNNELGTYIVWLLVGAGPMMSISQGGAFLIAEALALFASVVMARDVGGNAVAMLPFIFAMMSFSTYLGATRKLGARLLLIQVVCLDTFYSVVFAPTRNRLGRGGHFRWQRDRLRHDRSVRQLAVARPRRRDPAGIAGSERRAGSFAAARGFRFLPGSTRRAAAADAAADFGSSRAHGSSESSGSRGCVRASPGDPAWSYHARGAHRSRSGTPDHCGPPESAARNSRHGAARNSSDGGRDCGGIGRNVPRTADAHRRWRRSSRLPPRGRARERRWTISVLASSRSDQHISARRVPRRSRILQTFTDSLAALTGHVERLLDEPPQPPAAAPANNVVPRLTGAPDPAIVRYSLKVGACVGDRLRNRHR